MKACTPLIMATAVSLLWAAFGRAEERPALELSLDDAVKRALENNVDIVVERYNPLASAQSVRAAAGAYDPLLAATLSRTSRTTRADNVFAGADKVESSYELGGRKMAHTILRPTVTTLMELAMQEGVEWSMEEIAVGNSSAMIGLPLKDSGIRQNFNLIIIAINKPDGAMLFNPSFESVILPGDTVIAVGKVENLDKLEKVLNP